MVVFWGTNKRKENLGQRKSRGVESKRPSVAVILS